MLDALRQLCPITVHVPPPPQYPVPIRSTAQPPPGSNLWLEALRFRIMRTAPLAFPPPQPPQYLLQQIGEGGKQPKKRAPPKKSKKLKRHLFFFYLSLSLSPLFLSSTHTYKIIVLFFNFSEPAPRKRKAPARKEPPNPIIAALDLEERALPPKKRRKFSACFSGK